MFKYDKDESWERGGCRSSVAERDACYWASASDVLKDHSAFEMWRMTFPMVTQHHIPEHFDLYGVTGFFLSTRRHTLLLVQCVLMCHWRLCSALNVPCFVGHSVFCLSDC